MSPTKKINKWLVGFIIGGTILGLTGLSSTEKGRGFLGRCIQWFVTQGRAVLSFAERLGEKMAKRP